MTLKFTENGRLDRLLIEIKQAWLLSLKYIWHCLLRVTKPNQSRAVFLVGSGRSGTDILAHCLDQSLNVKLINEDNPLAFENWRLKALDDVKQVVSTAGAPVVVFKPIVETMRINELLETFPCSRAIFIIRDYSDSINSLVKFFGNSHVNAVNSWIESDFAKLPLVPNELKDRAKRIWSDNSSIENACGIYWLVYNSSYLFLNLRANERICLVAYESLVSESEVKLRELSDFLGLQYKKAMGADIYSTSVKRKPVSNLHPDLRRYCEETWDRLCETCTVPCDCS